MNVHPSNYLEICFYFRRYISNSTLFDKLVEVARSLPESRYPLGGNAPVMANRFTMEGCNVMLAASVSDSLKKEIASSIKGTMQSLFIGHYATRRLPFINTLVTCPVMAHLHCRRQISILIPILIPFLYWQVRIRI